ncbi:MAG: transcriptional regulator [Ignavibacteria bacterium]|nr:MAG: transcriptional regulator [Ignavibacteria bacterium]
MSKVKKPAPAGNAVEVWGLKTCGTTRKALKFLESKSVACVFRDVREETPPKTLINQALGSVDRYRKAFNTSGAAYKDGNWKVKVDGLNKAAALSALSADPMLIKRPIVRGPNGVTIGFDEDAIKKVIK